MTDRAESEHRRWIATEQPRCEGCARFVPREGHHPSDYRWCQRCADGLPIEAYRHQAMTDRIDAERLGWPMWPLSDVARAV